MKVLAIMGSPRLGGNTDTLVEAVLRGAAGAGAETEKVLANKLVIAGCQACDSCKKTGRCRIQDDMQPLYDKLLAADALILGTPIYFWGPSAQLKPIIDRWYALDQDAPRAKLAGKRVLLVCPCGDADPETARPTVDMLRIATTYMGMVFQEPLIGAGLSERKDAAQDAALLARAQEMGDRLIRH
jgi:multimeric flavodoxin WrbA